MRFDAVIELIAAGGYEQDGIGQQVPVEPTRRTVYANEFTLSASEFYDAGQQGFKPDVQYQVRSCEYAGERLMAINGVEYNIIRTQKNGEWTRLIGERAPGDV